MLNAGVGVTVKVAEIPRASAAVPAVLDELGGRHLREPVAAPAPRADVLAGALQAQAPYWDLRR